MPESNSLDALATTVSTQLTQLEQRLLATYGDARGADVHAAIQEERVRFRDAKVTAFVPIFVERHVRARLGAH